MVHLRDRGGVFAVYGQLLSEIEKEKKTKVFCGFSFLKSEIGIRCYAPGGRRRIGGCRVDACCLRDIRIWNPHRGPVSQEGSLEVINITNRSAQVAVTSLRLSKKYTL